MACSAVTLRTLPMKFTCIKQASLQLSLLVASANWVAADMFDELESETNSTADIVHSSSQSGQTFQAFKVVQSAEFNAYKVALVKEFEVFKRISVEEQAKYEAAIAEIWDIPVVSTQTLWVEYSKNMRERRSVDFEADTMTVAVVADDRGGDVSDAALRASVRKLLLKNRAEAFSDDVVASSIERRSGKELDPSMLKIGKVSPAPILISYMTGNDAASPAVVDYIVDSMIKVKQTTVSVNKQGKKVLTTSLPINVDLKELAKIDPKAFPQDPPLTAVSSRKIEGFSGMSPIVLPRAARQFSPYVSNYAEKARMSPSLLLAVMETESSFNPMAKSEVPAYGLMQIVPVSAGLDATEQLFGKAKILSPSYLYNSENNIQIGATYLNILYYRYLKGIEDPRSRLYCSIAAYNTGVGNVAKAFVGKRKIKPALLLINKMTPEEVYDHLYKNLPYAETKNYLLKVRSRLKKYGG